jgi:hypothetical protein
MSNRRSSTCSARATGTAVLAGVILALGMAAPASAMVGIDPDKPPPGVPDNPDIPLPSVPNDDVLGSGGLDAAPNPYGCRGSTAYPHESSGDVSVHARTKCRDNVGYVAAETSLYRERWYGAQHLDDGQSARNFSYTSYDAVARWMCYRTGTYTYYAMSSHEVTDGARRYTAATSAGARISC